MRDKEAFLLEECLEVIVEIMTMTEVEREGDQERSGILYIVRSF